MDLEQFYNEHINKVYKFFYIKCLDRHTAEDLTSQTFLLYVEHRRGGTQIENDTKYLYGIMRHIWSQYLRNKYSEAITGVENIEDFEDYITATNLSYESGTVLDRILPYIDMLPQKQGKVLRMRLVQEKSTEEVALELGKDKNYVKTNLYRGIKKLRQVLRDPNMFSMEEAK